MLSILLPVFRYDVTPLVRALRIQMQALAVPSEIVLLDDASGPEWAALHQPLGELSHVRYEVLLENIGRAAIRNRLAERAQYDYLLFLDGDSGVVRDDFLVNYSAHLAPQQVLCGGRIYAAQVPTDPTLRLHWHYGHARETRALAERQAHPHHGFMTNNFVVPKNLLAAIPFEEAITQYGHEDTLWGHALQAANIPILHLDNPISHLGLEAAEHWLGKQQQAIENLYRLHRQFPQLDTKALRYWRKLHRFGLLRVTYPWWRASAQDWTGKLLTAEVPNFCYLDLLKLYWLEDAHRKYGRGITQ
ncbi:MAG: glycosyltransferase [Bacteroidota bacterium]